MHLNIDPSGLRELVAEVVKQALAAAPAADAKLAFSEPEAARMMGLAPHVLADERRRGRISASKIVGARIRYTRADLDKYLAGRRYEADRGAP